MSESPADLDLLERAEKLSEDASRLEEAVAQCDDVLSRSPDSAAALNLKGFCLSKLERPAEALASFKLARLYLPNYPLIRYNLAHAFEDCGELAAAEAEYGEALKLDDSAAAPRRCRGGVRLRRGDFKGALEDLDEAVRREPGNAEGYVLRGAGYLGLGRKNEALEDFSKGLKLSPDQQARVEAILAGAAAGE